jgi:hypothetical protein
MKIRIALLPFGMFVHVRKQAYKPALLQYASGAFTAGNDARFVFAGMSG